VSPNNVLWLVSIEGSIHDNVVMGHSSIVCVSPNNVLSLPDVCSLEYVCHCERETDGTLIYCVCVCVCVSK